MHARLLFSWPAEPPYRELSDEIRDIEPGVYNAFVRLVDLPAGTGEVLETRTLGFTTEAKVELKSFRYTHHNGKHALDGQSVNGGQRSVAGAPPRGVLTYLEWVGPTYPGNPLPSIRSPRGGGSRSLPPRRSGREYFWPHARACIRQIGLSDRHVETRRILRWLKATGTTEVSLKDIRRTVLSQRFDADQTQELIDQLVRAGWLSRANHYNRRAAATEMGGQPMSVLSLIRSAGSAGTPHRDGKTPGPSTSADFLQFLHFLHPKRRQPACSGCLILKVERAGRFLSRRRR